MQITNGESSEVFCSCLVGGRGPARKGAPNKAWCVMLRNEVEGVTFWIHLEKKIFRDVSRKTQIGTHQSIGLCLCRDTLGETYIGEYICRVLLPECH
jgi:hypothetical protein